MSNISSSVLSLLQAGKNPDNNVVFSIVLSGADLTSADLIGITFVDVDFQGANFSDCTISNCNFINCNISNATFSNCNIKSLLMDDQELIKKH